MAREATLLLVFGGLGTASLLLASGEAPVTVATSHQKADVAPPAPAAATVDLAPRPAAVTDHTRDLELPDGTFVPALNGATDAAPLSTYWGPFPWSPIAGIERADGVDWYRHEDGSYSTTQMVWRSDLGTQAAMTRVAHPGPAPAATR